MSKRIYLVKDVEIQLLLLWVKLEETESLNIEGQFVKANLISEYIDRQTNCRGE